MSFNDGATILIFSAYIGILLLLTFDYIVECRRDSKQRQSSIDRELEKPNTVRIQEDPHSGECFLPLEDVLAGTNVNPNDVVYYEMLEERGTIVLTLYDKDKKQIQVGEK